MGISSKSKSERVRAGDRERKRKVRGGMDNSPFVCLCLKPKDDNTHALSHFVVTGI